MRPLQGNSQQFRHAHRVRRCRKPRARACGIVLGLAIGVAQAYATCITVLSNGIDR
jgi:hypothetical protein